MTSCGGTSHVKTRRETLTILSIGQRMRTRPGPFSLLSTRPRRNTTARSYSRMMLRQLNSQTRKAKKTKAAMPLGKAKSVFIVDHRAPRRAVRPVLFWTAGLIGPRGGARQLERQLIDVLNHRLEVDDRVDWYVEIEWIVRDVCQVFAGLDESGNGIGLQFHGDLRRSLRIMIHAQPIPQLREIPFSVATAWRRQIAAMLDRGASGRGRRRGRESRRAA